LDCIFFGDFDFTDEAESIGDFDFTDEAESNGFTCFGKLIEINDDHVVIETAKDSRKEVNAAVKAGIGTKGMTALKDASESDKNTDNEYEAE